MVWSPFTWNANGRILPDGREQIDFRIKHVNFAERLGQFVDWHPIDCSLKEGGLTWDVDDAPFKVRLPRTARGTAEFVSACEYDIFDKTVIGDLPFSIRITPLDVTDVTGIIENADTIRYPGAYPFGDLIYRVRHRRAPVLEKLVEIKTLPQGSGPLRIKFKITNDQAEIWTMDKKLSVTEQSIVQGLQQEVSQELSKTNNDVKELMEKQFHIRDLGKSLWDGTPKKVQATGLSFRQAQATGKRGAGFKTFQAWDGSKNRIDIEVEVEKLPNGEIELTKIIPRKFMVDAIARGESVLTDTTSTFYPDPNTETTSVDGGCSHEYNTNFAFGNGVSWATLIGSAGNNASSTSSDFGPGGNWADGLKCVMDNVSNRYIMMGRYAMLFDTSAIPDTDDISQAVASVTGSSKEDNAGVSPTWNIYTSAPASNTDIVSGDYDSFGSTAQCDTAITYSGYSTSGYNDWTLNATGRGNVSKTGVSKFGLRNANYDVAAAAPTWSSVGTFEIRGRSADFTGTDNDPKLVVTHAVPDSSSSPSSVSSVSSMSSSSVSSTSSSSSSSVSSMSSSSVSSTSSSSSSSVSSSSVSSVSSTSSSSSSSVSSSSVSSTSSSSSSSVSSTSSSSVSSTSSSSVSSTSSSSSSSTSSSSSSSVSSTSSSSSSSVSSSSVSSTSSSSSSSVSSTSSSSSSSVSSSSVSSTSSSSSSSVSSMSSSSVSSTSSSSSSSASSLSSSSLSSTSSSSSSSVSSTSSSSSSSVSSSSSSSVSSQSSLSSSSVSSSSVSSLSSTSSSSSSSVSSQSSSSVSSQSSSSSSSVSSQSSSSSSSTSSSSSSSVSSQSSSSFSSLSSQSSSSPSSQSSSSSVSSSSVSSTSSSSSVSSSSLSSSSVSSVSSLSSSSSQSSQSSGSSQSSSSISSSSLSSSSISTSSMSSSSSSSTSSGHPDHPRSKTLGSVGPAMSSSSAVGPSSLSLSSSGVASSSIADP